MVIVSGGPSELTNYMFLRVLAEIITKVYFFRTQMVITTSWVPL